MATATHLSLSAVNNRGHIHAGRISQRTADRVSELLMHNHEKFHILFHGRGLHNHILHHLLAIYALGASPGEVQRAYDTNVQYQLNMNEPSPDIADRMHDAKVFQQYVGNQKHYNNFLRFFTLEIAERGVEGTLTEYLFKGDERANDILARLYDGLLHPVIHLGYGIEFQQPLIVAEALAQAAITERWLEDTCDLVTERIQQQSSSQTPSANPSLLSLYERLRDNPVISNSVRPNDPPNKLRDGLIARAKEEIVPYLAEYTVQPHQLERKVAELANSSLYIAASAQRPGKVEMFDFFLMHSVNASIWFTVFIKQDWIPDQVKCRLVEIKGWSDLITYAACRTPAFRATSYDDDGHTAKFIRAIRNVEQVSRNFCGEEEFPLNPEQCLTIAHMVMDSVERMNSPDYRLPEQVTFAQGINEQVLRIIFRWVRWNGLDEAWEHVPSIDSSSRL
ncbi:hypothetical protein BGW36DRAFT_433896 [Talaromyces proteolyticus]|uniref:Oxidoreductase AflY n=1 Tax=Talaromyces proteolyticus TaxID=1131652 RepID=A0AAD4PSK0_9EURO|nr:uncharacterized protein BGW36DRAFT_433896 [Talaromyces proteolyticus]KAH8689131.1 hypothetical protein BGW36DRAFT_433896 [Talaromyces proteolyticus]